MGRYDDIIGLKHHESPTRPRMSMIDRGAQFSPFAALTGYEAVIAESARQTQSGKELDEGEISKLNDLLMELMGRLRQRPKATYLCFQPDERKAGGAYVRITGRLWQYDCMEQCLILTDSRRIPVESILDIEIAEEE